MYRANSADQMESGCTENGSLLLERPRSFLTRPICAAALSFIVCKSARLHTHTHRVYSCEKPLDRNHIFQLLYWKTSPSSPHLLAQCVYYVVVHWRIFLTCLGLHVCLVKFPNSGGLTYKEVSSRNLQSKNSRNANQSLFRDSWISEVGKGWK